MYVNLSQFLPIFLLTFETISVAIETFSKKSIYFIRDFQEKLSPENEHLFAFLELLSYIPFRGGVRFSN